MQFVNPNNLPLPLVEAIKNDTHVSLGSDLGAAAAVMPPRVVALARRHEPDIVIDVRNRMFSLWGQAVHVVLERAAKSDGVHVFAEHRAEIQVRGWRVATKLDHLAYDDSRCLTDYKVTSVWSVKDPEPKPEWVGQLNITHLVTVRGLNLEPFKRLQVTAFLRDYRKNEKLRYGREYPDAEMVNVPIPLWPLAQTEAYLEERVRLHQAARESLPLCTPDERWEKPMIYAVTKKGGKRATKLYEDRRLADEHAAKDKALEVRIRPGESVRCAQYCDVLAFCDQGKQILATLAAAAASEGE